MQPAVRPYVTTGVALVAASVIIVTPLAAPLPDVHIPTLHAPVALTQATNPYAQVFQDAVANLQTILSTAAGNPTPILTKILSNQLTTLQALLASGGAFTIPSLSQILTALTSQSGALQTLITATQTALGQVSTALTTTVPALLQTAFTDLTSLNVEGAINNVLLAGFTALFPLTGLLAPATAAIAQPLQNLVNAIDLFGPVATTLANPLQNVVNVLNLPTTDGLGVELIVAGLIAPLIQGPAAFGTAIQGVINAIGSGNLTNVLSAVIDAPAVFLGGLLNGQFDGMLFGPDVGPLVGASLGIPINAFFGGLLNQAAILPAQPPPPVTVLTILLPGVIPALQQLQSTIAGALNPPAIPAASAAPLRLTTAAASNAPSAVPNLAASTVTVPTTPTPKTGLAHVSAGTSANPGPATTVTATTITATTGLTGGTKTTGLTGGTKTTGGQVSSTVSKALSGLTAASSHVTKPAGHK